MRAPCPVGLSHGHKIHLLALSQGTALSAAGGTCGKATLRVTGRWWGAGGSTSLSARAAPDSTVPPSVLPTPAVKAAGIRGAQERPGDTTLLAQGASPAAADPGQRLPAALAQPPQGRHRRPAVPGAHLCSGLALPGEKDVKLSTAPAQPGHRHGPLACSTPGSPGGVSDGQKRSPGPGDITPRPPLTSLHLRASRVSPVPPATNSKV